MATKAYPLLEQDETGKWFSVWKITCTVIGEMSDGRKIWYCESNDTQYFLSKLGGRYYFHKG